MIFRLTQKLSVKIKAGTLENVPLDENPLTDWSAVLFVAGRTQYILLSNTRSLYSTVLYGKGITNDRQFIERALSSIREVMEDEGHEHLFSRFIAQTTGTIRFAKTLNRSMTGSMNDLIRQATYWLAEGDLSLNEVRFRLNEVPMSAIIHDGKPYGIPRNVFKALVRSFGM